MTEAGFEIAIHGEPWLDYPELLPLSSSVMLPRSGPQQSGPAIRSFGLLLQMIAVPPAYSSP
jgi:hypothetical protein